MQVWSPCTVFSTAEETDQTYSYNRKHTSGKKAQKH